MGRGLEGRERGQIDTASQVAARRAALQALNSDRIPYVVAGAYSMREYTGITRDTKDLDLCCRRADVARALACLASAGFRVEVPDPLWIAKGFAPDGEYVDLIFCSGNGVTEVDDLWFSRARHCRLMGLSVPMAAIEEIIWSKAYVQERERYDGADIHHLIRAAHAQIDWSYLLWRMAPHLEVLLAHLLLFGFAFPGEKWKVPEWVLDDLMAHARRPALGREARLCRGTFLSAVQYEPDLRDGLTDARPLEVARWLELKGER